MERNAPGLQTVQTRHVSFAHAEVCNHFFDISVNSFSKQMKKLH